jgi:uncharacterized protein
MNKIYQATYGMGDAIEADCLAASDGFSARYDLDRINGKFSRPAHQLFGQDYNGKILVLDTAKGGVATAWMLYEMKARNVFPAGIVLNSVNPILVQGAAHAGIPMLCGFQEDITTAIKTGARLRLDPTNKTLECLSP